MARLSALFGGLALVLACIGLYALLSYEVSRERFSAHGFSFEGDLRRGIGSTVELIRQANGRRS